MKKTALIFIGILVVTATLRLYKLGGVPSSMYIDEVAIGVDAKSLAQTGHDMHGNSIFSTMFPSYGDYKLPVYVWLATGSVKLFGATGFAVRLPSALAGIVTVALVFFLARELFEKDKHRDVIALCGAAITALLPWSILFSRTGFEGHVGQAIVLAA
ncbi:MAG TPA: glycosyltransferase family 39 protein, partial [Candidatus Saccharimonadia bacterium]|nr:glycosyltransferase family 39 protein [Candidatus Saccharimonadia bacterium]